MNRLATNGHSGASEAVTEPRPASGFTPASKGMDIARPDLARRRQRLRIFWGLATVVAASALTFFLARLEKAIPSVDASTLWTNSVERGGMVRQVRGNGVLVPEQIQWVQAETGGIVENLFVQPGAEVAADTAILQLGNQELQQQSFDADWAARASQAQLEKLKVSLESDRLAQESQLVTLRADAHQAVLEFHANEVLAHDGLVPGLELERTKAKAEDLASRVTIEEKRLRFAVDSSRSQLAVQEAEVEKLRALFALRRRQVDNLTVRAGIAGVLTQLGDLQTLQRGQRVTPSAILAKVVVPSRLKAEIRIAETQARDIARGQNVEIDTRNGVVPGQVLRIDPAVQNGTVLVEVKLTGPLPRGSRPDLSVEGTIELERLENVLNVGRPVVGQPESTVGLFKLTQGGRRAVRVPVHFGRSSVSRIEILGGLEPGDIIILNDLSRYDGQDALKID